MRVAIYVTVETECGSTPLFNDVRNALIDQLQLKQLNWDDPSLGRYLTADIRLEDVKEANE